MGQITNITITHAPDLTAEQLADAADGHLHNTTAWTADDGTHHLQGSSTWSPEDFIAVVVSLTDDLPDARVTVDEEWDTHDADESGQIISRYRGGELLSQATLVSGLVPTDLTAAIANVRAALEGEGDLTASAAWLVDGLEGDRT